MARPTRIEFPGAIYHVMSRGVNGMATFYGDEDRIDFLKVVGEFVKSELLRVHAFCLMTNHFHVLCDTPKAGLARCMQKILSWYTQRFNRRHERTGHLWQARYKAIVIEEGDYFLTCSRYIHLNPMRAGMVRSLDQFVWSSYPCYLGMPLPVDWVTKEKTLALFKGVDDYCGFVKAGLQDQERSPFERSEGGIAFGSDAFVERMASLADGLREGSQAPVPDPLPEVSRRVQEIRNAVDMTFSDLSHRKRERVFVYVLRRYILMRWRDIAQHTQRGLSTLDRAFGEIRSRIDSDPGFSSRLEHLLFEIRRMEEGENPRASNGWT